MFIYSTSYGTTDYNTKQISLVSPGLVKYWKMIEETKNLLGYSLEYNKRNKIMFMFVFLRDRRPFCWNICSKFLSQTDSFTYTVCAQLWEREDGFFFLLLKKEGTFFKSNKRQFWMSLNCSVILDYQQEWNQYAQIHCLNSL